MSPYTTPLDTAELRQPLFRRPLAPPLPATHVLGTRIHHAGYQAAVDYIMRWAHDGVSAYVCTCNVHMVMEGYDQGAFQHVVNQADLVTPDSIGVALALSAYQGHRIGRASGPDLMLRVCERAAAAGVRIGLYGATEDCLVQLSARLQAQFPTLDIACQIAPPFGELEAAQEAAYVEQINAAQVGLLFVGLGCPKQERWMYRQRGRIQAVMMGVGAAFDFHAGLKPRAPSWIRRTGLEWAYRLMREPRRLWKRNVKHSPRFVALALQEAQRLKRQPPPAPRSSTPRRF
ncbi:MAG: WecB/TagA/CpsF family glycosyltransferase [Bacteroidota bacterium]